MSKNNNNNTPHLRFPGFTGEWVEKKLGEVASSFSGGTPKSSESKYYGGDIPFIRSGEIHGCKTELYITEEGLNKSSAKLVSKGDLLIALYGATSGEVAISKIDGAINQAILCVRSQSINSNYLCNYLEYKKDTITSKFLQGGQGNLSSDIIMSLNIPSPTPAEQRKIASCLSAMDNLISAQSQKVEALKDQKKGMMQQLFPQKGETTPRLRFPEFSGEWKEYEFGDCFEIGSGRDYKHLDEGHIPVYGSGGYMCSVNDYLYDGESACIGRKGTINNPILLSGKFWTVDTLFYTYNYVNTTAYFIYLLFQNIDWMKHNEAGGVPSLSKSIIYNISVYLPSPAEQQKIANCLSELDDLIASETKQLEALKDHKKGLMQQLFPQPAK